jgi:signal transduction histidine kinase
LIDRLRDLAGSVALSLVTIQALSDQRAARNEAVEARNQAEKAASVKGNFLAQMSHDLRTPLNAILGWSEAMSTGAVPLTPERARAYAQHIHVAGGQLRALIEEILDLSEAEGGRVGPRRPVPLRPVLAEILHTLRQAAKAKGVVLHIDVPRGTPAVLGDRLALFKLMQNALAKAVSHNLLGGGIWIQAQPVGSGRLCLDICDNGPGFPAARLKRMFQPFHEEYDAATANRKGFGLGMAIIKASAERMGGSVEAGQAPQGGARISVLLDLAPAEPEPEDFDGRADGAGGGAGMATSSPTISTAAA